MTAAWKTKYGSRRVRHDPPDLLEAITAAQGLTDDLDGQAEIAAQLMDVPVDDVKVEIARLAAEEKAREQAAKKSRTLTIAAPRHGGQTAAVVVVERRRSIARPVRRVYDV